MKDFVSNHTPVAGTDIREIFLYGYRKDFFCSCLEVIDLVAYKSEGCVENARDWLYMRLGMLFYHYKLSKDF